ncbi:D-alanyl-D-alanine carboxypeptidase (penicillin-binding protein 5/6) [Lachnospiraceae bacterium A10]|nr:D-alanyl-D-alanine carboxypeptidase (penicillin-binding protein 5/6) [Lachnospiraceae bacterium A10]
MKCTNKFLALVLALSLTICLTGCSKDNTSYDVYKTSHNFGIIQGDYASESNLFASNLAVTDTTNVGMDTVDSQVASGAGVFNLATKEVTYSQNIFEKLYPASTTKILTAYVALKYGDLDQEITVSENACDQAEDSSVANLNPGDKMTLRDLLYGLMLRSGNDAAIAIAEGISGDVDTFVNLMNQEATALGAVNSHFVTPNGLHDEDHYTTVYDMYLIFNAAIQNDDFRTILQTTTYNVFYTTSDGTETSQTWNTTNYYLLGKEQAPDGITVIGGKTGTTGEAGYCLVLLSKNEQNQQIISIVFDADARTNLYYLMNEILNLYGE